MLPTSCIVPDSTPILRACLYQLKHEAKTKKRKKMKGIHTLWEEFGGLIVRIAYRDICGFWVWIYGGGIGENSFCDLTPG